MPKFRLHDVKLATLKVTQVDGQFDATRNDIAGIGMDLNRADCRGAERVNP